MGKDEDTTKDLIVTDDLLIRYLLGELQEAERIQVAERAFLDDDLFDQLIEAENDLIDRYASAELIGRERELFEKTILRRKPMLQRVRFARALNVAISRVQRAQRPLGPKLGAAAGATLSWYWLAAAAALVVAVSAAVWVIRKSQYHPQQAQTQSADQPASDAQPPRTTASEDLNGDAEHAPPLRTTTPGEGNRSGQAPQAHRDLPGAVATFVLLPGRARSGSDSQIAAIRSGVRSVKLELQLEEGDDYQAYGVVVRTVRGDEVLNRARLSSIRLPFGKAVVVELAASRFGPGQYELELSGHSVAGPATIVNYYYFTIVKSN